MDFAIIFAEVLVFGAFALSGWSKLDETAETGATAQAFGLPARMSAALGVVLAPAELAIAAALLLPMIAWLGAIAAAVLLCAFVGAMVFRLAQGEAPSCNCFGHTKPQPITWATVIRNLVLLFAALHLVAAGPEQSGLVKNIVSTARGPFGVTLALAVLTAVAAVSIWLALLLLRQQGRLILRIDNLKHRLDTLDSSSPRVANGGNPFQLPASTLHVGRAAPVFTASTLGGRVRTLVELIDESAAPVLLLFVGAECAPCREVVKEMLGWRRADGLPVAWATIASGEPEVVRQSFPGLAIDRVLVQAGSELNDLYGVVATPSAVWIERDGSIASSVAIGRDAILALFNRHVSQRSTGNAISDFRAA